MSSKKKGGGQSSLQGSSKSTKSLAAKASSALSTLKRKAISVISPKKSKKTRADLPHDGRSSCLSPSLPSLASRETRKRTAWVEDMEDDDEVVTISSDGESVEEPDNADVEAEEAEEQLEQMKKKWTSPVYAFFNPDVKVCNGKDNRRYHLFRCAARGCKFELHRYLDKGDRSSTSNMIRHVRSCWGEDAFKAAKACRDAADARKSVTGPLSLNGSITAAFAREKGKGKITYSHLQHTREETKVEIVKWLTECGRPFKIVADRGFQSLMKTGRPGYYIPSPSQVSRDVKLVFARSRERIAKLLQEYDGRISFATDAWTSPNHYAYVAVTAHLVHGGVPIAIVLDVVEVPKSHTGLNLAVAFQGILREFGIENKILSVTCDNASNNDTMVEELAKALPGWSAVNRTRCFAHIINLIAKSLLKQFNVKKKASNDSPGTESDSDSEEEQELRDLAEGLDEEEEELLLTILDNDDELEEDDLTDWVDELAEMDVGEREDLLKEIRPVSRVLVKLRKLAFKIINSTTILLPAWKSCLEAASIAVKLMPRDVSTRWNSTYDMLAFAVKHKKQIGELTSDLGNNLRAFELSKEEWAIAEELRDTLKILKHTTEFFSRGSPNLPAVIPAMDHIDSTFTNALLPTSNTNPAIRAAISTAKKTLNRYYSKTDEAEVYRIAMVLHPARKLEYFEDAGWEQEWIDVAKGLVRTQFEAHYASLPVDEGGETQSQVAEPAAASHQDDNTMQSNNIFDNLPAPARQRSKSTFDELQLYLSSDTEDVNINPIHWWQEKKKTYPRLHRMALDYLSIPATSVDVERLFSRGRLVLSHTRSRLSPLSTRAILCVGCWSLLDLIRTDDVKAVVNMDDVDAEVELNRVAALLRSRTYK